MYFGTGDNSVIEFQIGACADVNDAILAGIQLTPDYENEVYSFVDGVD